MPHSLSIFNQISTMGATSCNIHRTARFHILDPFRAIIATPLRNTARPAAQPYIARTTHIHVRVYAWRGKGWGKGQRGSDNPAKCGRPRVRTHTPSRPPCQFVHCIMLKSSLPMAPLSTLKIHTHHSLVRLAYSYNAFC